MIIKIDLVSVFSVFQHCQKCNSFFCTF